MKHYDYFAYRTAKKYQTKNRRREYKSGGFTCSHCKRFVIINDIMGTANRNHCSWCLWSKHVDEATGDRRAHCGGGMQPIGLTFKYTGRSRIGEIMLIHLCVRCEKLSINRIARDDPESGILATLDHSRRLSSTYKAHLAKSGIYLVVDADRPMIDRQLFGDRQPT